MARNAPANTEEELGDWATSSGMPDKFVGYMEQCFFGVDEKYNADAMLFCAQLVDEQGEPITTLKYSVGQDWETDNDGTALTHPSKTKINNSSRFGRFIDRIAQPTDKKAPNRPDVKSPDGKENGLGLGPILKSRGLPTVAASFEGLGFFWEQHEMETMGVDEKTKKPIVKQVLLPTAYIGTWEERESAAPKGRSSRPGRPVGAAPAATRPAAPQRPTAAAANGESEEEGGDVIDLAPALRKKLTSKAQSSTSKEFLKWAAKDPEVLALPDETMNVILGGGPNGFWQSVQPE